MALSSGAIGADLGEPLVIAALVDWTIVAYVWGGLTAWVCRPASRLGPLMVGAGFGTALLTLTWATHPLLYTVGQAVDKLPQVLFLHVFLAFPDGRLRARYERLLVAIAYLAAVVPELVRMVVGDYGPDNLLGVARNQAVFDVVRGFQLIALATCCVVGVVMLLVRSHAQGRPVRLAMGLVVQGFALALLLIAALDVLLVWGGVEGLAVQELRWCVFFALGLAPVVLLAGLLQVRLARVAVGDLVMQLSTHPSPSALRDALAAAVADPTLQVVYWLPEYHRWADGDGRVVELPEPSRSTATTQIDRDGDRVAALVHHPSLLEEPELLRAVGAAAGMALENARLQAELRARVNEVAGSRLRVLEAGQRERKRLERDLHDGAQQRLVALTLDVAVLQERLADDPIAQDSLGAMKRELGMSLDELRDVARGIHPAVLTGHGLGLALESLAGRSTMPLRLQVDLPHRLPEPVEVAVYYVVCECLANVEKHARALATTVSVRSALGAVVVDVVDDGIGGVDEGRGSGLRGLADRVEALGGRLQILSPPEGGTAVHAEIPCE